MCDKVLVLGAGGFIGGHVAQALGPKRVVAGIHRRVLTIPVLETFQFDAVRDDLESQLAGRNDISHAVITVLSTRAEKCAADEAASYATNVTAIQRILRTLKRHDIVPVFFSTDFVFDGRLGQYSEEDAPSPLIVYGRQKVEVEEFLRSEFSEYLLIRISKTYGVWPGDGTLFANWLADLNNQKTVIECAADQVFSPIMVEDVAQAVRLLIERRESGIFHVANSRAWKRIELLELFLEAARKRGLGGTVEIQPRSLNDFGLLEIQPLNTSLNPEKYLKLPGAQVRDVPEALPLLFENFKRQS